MRFSINEKNLFYKTINSLLFNKKKGLKTQDYGIVATSIIQNDMQEASSDMHDLCNFQLLYAFLNLKL